MSENSQSISFIDDLNDVQRPAATHINGPMMIVAGAGSGKTRVLTYRIAYLIKNNVDSFNIIALTFTNKASKEMRERIMKLVGNEAKNLWMGTFHSLFARILRIEHDRLGYPQNFSIYDTDDSKSLIKAIVKELNLDEKLYKPGLVLNRISNSKNNLINAYAYANDVEAINYDKMNGRGLIADIFRIYTERCFRAGAMDFDDILLKTYELFFKHTDVLNKYQHKFKYVLVDEFQDTNVLQYQIIKMLSAVYENICVVGDDAQSIYGFRGATIDNILNFEKDYPDLKVYKLEQNYRSTANIVGAAGNIIAKNKNQIEKEVWTQNDEGEKIRLIKAVTDNEEGIKIADIIFEEKMRNHFMNSDFAILYRTNAQSRSFEEALRKRNIAYKIFGGLSFYHRKEIRDIVAYFRLTINNNDEEALKRVINYPARGIGKTSMDRLMIAADKNNISLWEALENIHNYPELRAAISTMAAFRDMIKSFAITAKNNNAYDTAMNIARQSGLYKELSEDRSVEGISRLENINELMNGIKEFSEDDTSENEKILSEYIKDIALLTDADKNDEEENNKVKLMTIHAAKGLEFPVVFVVGLEENLFPNQMSLDSRSQLEEERRLFYVAVTRAEKKLHFSFASSRFRHGQTFYAEPSRFLYEIDRDRYDIDLRLLTTGAFSTTPNNSKNIVFKSKTNYTTKETPTSVYSKIVPPTISNFVPSTDFRIDDNSELKADDKVIHQRFGHGVVVEIEGTGDNKKAKILFAEVGEKNIILRFAKLQIIS